MATKNHPSPLLRTLFCRQHYKDPLSVQCINRPEKRVKCLPRIVLSITDASLFTPCIVFPVKSRTRLRVRSIGGRRERSRISAHQCLNPVQFPADKGPECTVFSLIRVPGSQFLHRTVTPDRCEGCGRLLPCFGQLVFIKEAVDKDTHRPAASSCSATP